MTVTLLGLATLEFIFRGPKFSPQAADDRFQVYSNFFPITLQASKVYSTLPSTCLTGAGEDRWTLQDYEQTRCSRGFSKNRLVINLGTYK